MREVRVIMEAGVKRLQARAAPTNQHLAKRNDRLELALLRILHPHISHQDVAMPQELYCLLSFASFYSNPLSSMLSKLTQRLAVLSARRASLEGSTCKLRSTHFAWRSGRSSPQ